ncbi:hypothetical protein Ancab_032723, partial [Ancistrocladus abbreviatus]
EGPESGSGCWVILAWKPVHQLQVGKLILGRSVYYNGFISDLIFYLYFMENPSFREALAQGQSSTSPVAWEAFYGPRMFTFWSGWLILYCLSSRACSYQLALLQYKKIVKNNKIRVLLLRFWGRNATTSHVSNTGGKSVYPQTQPPIQEPILQEPKRDKVRLNCSLPTPPTVLPSYLSIGATLSIAPCLPISPDLTTPLVSGLDFGLPPTPFVPPLYEGVQDENLATLLITNVNEKIEGNVLLDQILYPPHRTENIDMNSNDTVLKNLKQLDVENSISEGPSI